MINGVFTEIQWSHFSNAFATIDINHNVHIFSCNENELKLPIPNQGKNTAISWSYHSNLLAIGSNNGTLIIFSNDTFTFKSFKIKDITSPISRIIWNEFFEEICIITKDNRIVILSISKESEISTIFSIKNEFFVEHLTFQNSNQLIFNNKEGEIYLVTKNSQKYLTTILIPVSFIYCSRLAKNQVITISSDNIFTKFFLSDELELKKLDQRKLNDGIFSHIEETNEGSLIYSINDTIYLEKNETKTFELKIQKDNKITDFHFYQYSRSLAAISERGEACIWHLDDEIQLIRRFELCKTHTKSFWSPFSKSVITTNDSNSLFSVSKVPKIAYLNNSKYFELLQIDSHTVMTNSMEKIHLENQPIERIRQSTNHFILATKSSYKIYNFNFECINEFSIQPSLIECFGTRVFIMNGKTIEIKNMIDNSSINHITIDSDGIIIKTALNGSFLAFLTSFNEIFIYDLSKFSIKQVSKLDISNLTKTETEIKTVTSLGISSGGFCVSISCRSAEKRYNPILVSTFEKDKSRSIVSLEEAGRIKWETETPNLFCIQTEESSLKTYLIDDNFTPIKLKSLHFPDERILLKVSLPRFFYLPSGNTEGIAVLSNFLPSFACLDEAPIDLKRSIVLLMIDLQNENYESALKLIQSINDRRVLRDFLSDNKKLELLQHENEEDQSKCSNEQVEPETEISFAELMHESFVTGDLSLLLTEANKGNRKARNWFGRFAEAKNDKKTALLAFQMCKNTTEQIRLLCSERRFEEAKQLIDKTTDKSAICYFARLLMKLITEMKNNTNNESSNNNTDKDTNTTNYNVNNNESSSNNTDKETNTTNYNMNNNESNNNNASKNESTTNYNMNNKHEYTSMKNNDFKSNEASINDDDDRKPSFFDDREKVSHLIVDLFARAGRYGMAFEFAAQEEMLDEVEKLAPLAPKKLVYKVASSYESRNRIDAATRLYFVANFASEAVRCASAALNAPDSDASCCAELFEKAGNNQEAVIFYVYSDNIEKAAEICEKFHLKISDDLASFLSTFHDESAARMLEQQGQFILAAQVYTNLNEPTKALKSLFQSKNVDEVIKFTKQAKNTSCYQMSADFIAENLNPRRNSPLFQVVIDFYSKSENYEKVAKFVKSRAKIEIDVKQNYERALSILNESKRWLAMADPSFGNDFVDIIMKESRWIEMYLEAANADSPEVMKSLCEALINTKGALDLIRYEDIAFLLIKNFLDNDDFNSAKELIEKLKSKGVNFEKFMEIDSINRIYRATKDEDPLVINDEMPDVENIIIEHFSDY